jgi:hypothetical protein
MAVNRDRLTTVNSKPPIAHVEVVTENGFTIARVCELGLSINDSASECNFIVSKSSGSVRSIKVEFTEEVITMVQAKRRQLSRTSFFWLHCAEHRLADYLWDNDCCPPNYLLKIDSLSSEELLMAARWD